MGFSSLVLTLRIYSILTGSRLLEYTKSMLKKILVLAVRMIPAGCQSNLPSWSHTLSAGDLTIQYKESKDSARSKYDGKEITVRGFVVIEAVMPGEDEYEGLITLEDKDANSASQILCWFSREEAEKFSSITGRQYVTVKGIFNGERGPELKFCKLVEVE